MISHIDVVFVVSKWGFLPKPCFVTVQLNVNTYSRGKGLSLYK